MNVMKTNGETLPYSCDSCPMSFASMKELTEHYEEKHPEMIEKIIMPI